MSRTITDHDASDQRVMLENPDTGLDDVWIRAAVDDTTGTAVPTAIQEAS